MTFPFYEDWLVLFGKDRAPVEAIDREEALGEGEDTNFTINIDEIDFSSNSGSGGGATSTPTREERRELELLILQAWQILLPLWLKRLIQV